MRLTAEARSSTSKHDLVGLFSASVEGVLLQLAVDGPRLGQLSV